MFDEIYYSENDEFVKLEQIFELNVFCPIHIPGDKDIAVAYLMNDAVESFLIFRDSVMTGIIAILMWSRLQVLISLMMDICSLLIRVERTYLQSDLRNWC